MRSSHFIKCLFHQSSPLKFLQNFTEFYEVDIQVKEIETKILHHINIRYINNTEYHTFILLKESFVPSKGII